MSGDAAAWRVLVVDDDTVDRQSVRRGLRRAGLSVEIEEAATGAEALALLAGREFDCVFLDYNLPGGDGLSLLPEIRRVGRDVPVVVLTGHGDEQVAVQLMKAGAADYLAKSEASPERLASSLRYATELARAQLHARIAEKELRASVSRARFLAEASATLARSLDVEATLEHVAQLSVPILGDHCFIYAADSGAPRRVASAFSEAATETQGRETSDESSCLGSRATDAVAEVLRTGRRLVLNRSPDGGTFALVVPVIARAVVGALAFCRADDGASYTDEDAALAEDLASRVAAAMENARLYQQAEQARERTERLQRVTAKLSAVVSRQELAELFISQARDALGGAMAWLALVSENAAELRAIATVGFDESAVAPFAQRALAAAGPGNDVLRNAVPVWFSSKEAVLAAHPSLAGAMADLRQEAVLILPLASGSRVTGVMTVGFLEPRQLTDDEIALGMALAQQCAQALERARLFDAEHEARAEAENARRDAEEANRTKSEFLARMSHDLRTPLNAIAGYAQLIEEGIYGEPTEGQRESLIRIRRAQAHLLALINDVLSFAKLEAGQVHLHIEDVPLGQTLEAVSGLMEPQVAAKGLSLRLGDVPQAATVRADRDRLSQILLNLLTNAVKFTPPGGQITLHGERRPGSVSIRVTDNGQGIEAARLNTIFDPFVQGGQAETDRQGVGLGLAIGRELAHMMAGELSAVSEVGHGSTFELTLPSGDPVMAQELSRAEAALA